VIPIFFAKQIMMNNQVEKEIIKQAREWDNHNVVTLDYEKANVIYFPSR
jgi:predicted transglutaminase-like protease